MPTINFLIDKGIDLNKKNEFNETVLMRASTNDENYELVELLLSKGASMYVDGGSILRCAISYKAKEIIKLFIKNKIDLEVTSSDGWPPLASACYDEYDVEMVKILIKAGAKLESKVDGGWTPLLIACQSDENLAIAKELIKNGANFEVKNTYGNTPLLIASANGSLNILDYLISTGANTKITNNDNENVVSVANNEEIRAYLRKKGIK